MLDVPTEVREFGPLLSTPVEGALPLLAAGALAASSSSVSGSGSSGIGNLAYNAAQWGKVAFNTSDPANDKKAAAITGNARRSNRRSS